LLKFHTRRLGLGRGPGGVALKFSTAPRGRAELGQESARPRGERRPGSALSGVIGALAVAQSGLVERNERVEFANSS
jgi:hypothetical protein